MEKEFEELKNLVDDTVTKVYIPTPKGWKCKRKGCKSEVKHIHATYAKLNGTNKDNRK